MYSVKDENRFWSKILTGNEDECWEIVGLFLNRTGYGELRVNGTKIRAHRFSYQLFHNRLIKDKMVICHKCDNPSCVNPYHLFEGTMKDNMNDRDNKGRGLKGEKNGRSKLTEAQVKEIRTKYAAGGTSYKKLGEEYGINQSLISNIINYKM